MKSFKSRNRLQRRPTEKIIIAADGKNQGKSQGSRQDQRDSASKCRR
jgi:hypothetical protein